MSFYIFYGIYHGDRINSINRKAFLDENQYFRKQIYTKFNLNFAAKEEIFTRFYKKEDVYMLNRELKKPKSKDTVIMRSPLDIAKSIKTSIGLIEDLHKRQCQIYIYSFSPVDEYALYRRQLLQTLNLQFETKKRIRKTTYPIELLELGATLRAKYPPVCYSDLEKYLGINRSTLSMHIKRTRGPQDNTKSRSIDENEILEIEKLKTSLQNR